MSIPTDEADIGGTNVPQGAAPNLDSIPEGEWTTPPEQGLPEFSSPDLNPDGDWVRFEHEDQYEVGYSVFHNRFRVDRAEARDEIVRREVSRKRLPTRVDANGMCVTEDEVTYENFVRHGYVLRQYYEYFILNKAVKEYYDYFTTTEATLVSAGAGAVSGSVGGAVGTGAVGTGGTAGVAGAAAGVGLTATIGACLLAGGAAFIGTTQHMAEVYGASEVHSTGWWPILWYHERERPAENRDPLTVTETVAVHPCDRPVTGSPYADEHNLVHSPSPVQGLDPIEPGEPPADGPASMPDEEGDLPHDPEAGVDPADLDADPVPEVDRPDFRGEGDELSSPDFDPENDWYRDLGRRGGYYFVVQYLNSFREVPDSRFDSRSEDYLPTNRLRHVELGDGMCQDEEEHDVITYLQEGMRIDQQFQIWRVDSEEAVVELKRAMKEATSGTPHPTGPTVGASTASMATGALGTAWHSGKVVAGFNALGWVSTVISIFSLSKPPVPVGAGWTPVAHYLLPSTVDLDDRRTKWLPDFDPYPCPKTARPTTGGTPPGSEVLVSGGPTIGVGAAPEPPPPAPDGAEPPPEVPTAPPAAPSNAEAPPAIPTDQMLQEWFANPGSVPKQWWGWARQNLGYAGPMTGFVGGPTQPALPQHLFDRFVIERALANVGWPVEGATKISTSSRPATGEDGAGRLTRLVFPVDQNGDIIDKRQPIWQRIGQYPAGLVLVDLHTKDRSTFWSSIRVYDTVNDQMRAIGSTGSDGKGRYTDGPAEAVRRAQQAITDENGHIQLLRPFAYEPPAETSSSTPSPPPEPTATDPSVPVEELASAVSAGLPGWLKAAIAALVAAVVAAVVAVATGVLGGDDAPQANQDDRIEAVSDQQLDGAANGVASVSEGEAGSGDAAITSGPCASVSDCASEFLFSDGCTASSCGAMFFDTDVCHEDFSSCTESFMSQGFCSAAPIDCVDTVFDTDHCLDLIPSCTSYVMDTTTCLSSVGDCADWVWQSDACAGVACGPAILTSIGGCTLSNCPLNDDLHLEIAIDAAAVAPPQGALARIDAEQFGCLLHEFVQHPATASTKLDGLRAGAAGWTPEFMGLLAEVYEICSPLINWYLSTDGFAEPTFQLTPACIRVMARETLARLPWSWLQVIEIAQQIARGETTFEDATKAFQALVEPIYLSVGCFAGQGPKDGIAS